MFWDMNLKPGIYTSSRWHDTWGLSFITIRSMPLESFLDFFLNVLRYQLQSWFIHSVGCTTCWVHVSPEWGPCDLLHVLSLVTVNWQGIYWCWRIRQSLTALAVSRNYVLVITILNIFCRCVAVFNYPYFTAVINILLCVAILILSLNENRIYKKNTSFECYAL